MRRLAPDAVPETSWPHDSSNAYSSHESSAVGAQVTQVAQNMSVPAGSIRDEVGANNGHDGYIYKDATMSLKQRNDNSVKRQQCTTRTTTK